MDNTHEKAVSATVRTVAILEALSEEGNASLEPLSARLGLAKPTLFRFLKTLKHLGYVIQHDDLTYSLSLRMYNIGAKAMQSMDITKAAEPVIKDLSKRFGETIHVAVMMDEAVVYIMKIESKHTIRMYSTIGRRAPLYCTSLGKSLLAWSPDREALIKNMKFTKYTEKTIVSKKDLRREMDEIRLRGYSIDAEEHEPSIHCIGAPIFDFSGNVVAAVSVAWPTFRFDLSREKEWAMELMKSAALISGRMGFDKKA